MNKVYDRINWENTPSIATPINESNLNKMDYAIDEIDRRVVDLASKDSTLNEAIQKANESIEKLNNDSADFKAFNERQDNPHNVTKEQVGLGKVDNTADKDKYVFHANAADIASGDRNGKVIDLVYETIENVNSKDAETLKAAKEYADAVVESTNLTKTATGTTLHLTDTVDGKGELREIVRNLADNTDVIKEDWKYMIGAYFEPNTQYSIRFVTSEIIRYPTLSITDASKNKLFTIATDELLSNDNHFTTPNNLTEGKYYLLIEYYETHSDIEIKAMLTKGTTAHPYVPYEGYEVKSCGKNLFDIRNAYIESTWTKNGTYLGNDVYTSNSQWFGIRPSLEDGKLKLKSSETYIMSAYIKGEAIAFYNNCTVISSSHSFANENPTTFSNWTKVWIKYKQGDINNIGDLPRFESQSTSISICCIQIEKTNTVTDYEPYKYDSATITTDTDVAYVDTFDGETNIFTDYDIDMNVEYGANEIGSQILANTGEIAMLKAEIEALKG